MMMTTMMVMVMVMVMVMMMMMMMVVVSWGRHAPLMLEARTELGLMVHAWSC